MIGPAIAWMHATLPWWASVAPWWFGPIILTLDLGVFVNLLLEVGILLFGLWPVGPTVTAPFARRLMSGNWVQGLGSMGYYGNFIVVYWIVGVPATVSVALWWVRLVYAGLMLVGTTRVIAALADRLTGHGGWLRRLCVAQALLAAASLAWLALHGGGRP